MNQYKFYRASNYIVISDNISEETFYGFVKEVQVDKSNANKASYRVFNVKDFDNTVPLVITQILKEDGSPYTEAEFDTFYTQNTGNFNGGGSAPGVQSVTGTVVDNTDPANPVINALEEAPEDGETYGRQDGNWVVVSGGGGSQDLQQTLDNGNGSTTGFNINEGVGGEYISEVYSNLLQNSRLNGENTLYKTRILAEGLACILIDGSERDLAGIALFTEIDNNYGLLKLRNSLYNASSIIANPLSTSDEAVFQLPLYDGSQDETRTLATLEGITPDITIVNTGNHTIPDGVKTRIITLTDNTPQIVTLPAVADAIGSIYFITNDSTSTVDINSKSGGNDIWDGGLTFSTKMAIAGTPVRIINDGLNYKVL